MNTWNAFLTQQGAQFDDRGVVGFNRQFNSFDNQSPRVIPLTNLGCLWVCGPETKKFLQGQVTCDVQAVTPFQPGLDETTFGCGARGAHCNGKGRMVFDFHVFCTSDGGQTDALCLIMEQDLITQAEAALKKYIVFSKAQLRHDPEGHSPENHSPENHGPEYHGPEDVLIGVTGAEARTHLEAVLATALPIESNGVVSLPGSTVLALSPDRFMCRLSQNTALSLWPRLIRDCLLTGYPLWDLLDIRAGEGHVRTETTETFLPQHLNFQITGGVSFTKGCYIGQEVVARMQYKGKLKRHMRRAQIEGTTLPPSGTELYGGSSQQSIGNVVSAAPGDSDTIEMLVVITDDEFNTDNAYLDRERTQKLHFLPLPYAITN